STSLRIVNPSTSLRIVNPSTSLRIVNPSTSLRTIAFHHRGVFIFFYPGYSNSALDINQNSRVLLLEIDPIVLYTFGV
ncbi:hypothetical protein C4577_07895, partial [Candidatus Parcubacteria bacterium]